MHYDIQQSFAMEIESTKEIREMTGTSLFCCKPENCLRRICWQISTN
jgi:hypothetical protein